jgi:2-methylcitrate synthase/citrate synthase II
MSDERPYSPGLEGIVAGITSISEVNPEKQKLTYRGYDIEELAAQSTYEEVAYLLLNGALPTKKELAAFSSQLSSERKLPPPLYQMLKLMPLSAEPMDAIRTCVSLLGGIDPDVGDNSHDANLRKAIRLIAKMATMVAAHYRMRAGLSPVEPSGDLAHAADLFCMITGRRPQEFEARALDITLILYAEHTFNASTFTARVIASTLGDMHAAMSGALGALKGPLHGGANERVMEMLLEIGDPSKAEEWIMKALKEKRRIMGFGHRIYKWGDSRVPTLKRIGNDLAERLGEKRWVDIADIVERVMEREKGLYPNADFPCACIYYMLGFPTCLYTPIFAASRMAGWAAHVIEQHNDNRLIRPDSIYRGHRSRVYTSLDQRGSSTPQARL